MIADRIRQARLAAGLTLGALGEKVGERQARERSTNNRE